jgi:hypothetical protein
VLKYIISPAVEPLGYKPLRADQISEPGIITSQVIQRIIEDELIIADLSDRNPNVFYELALRHALRKPFVQIIKKGEAIPFDIASSRIIHFDITDLDSVEAAKVDITKQIQAVEKGAVDIETPITMAIDLMSMRKSDNPEQRSIAELTSAIAGIRRGIERLELQLLSGIGLPGTSSVSSFRKEDAILLKGSELITVNILGKLVTAVANYEYKKLYILYQPKSAEEIKELVQRHRQKIQGGRSQVIGIQGD